MVTQARLKELLDYDPATGLFRWRVTVGSRANAGTVAGSSLNAHGYCVCRVDGKKYYLHRLAWFYVHGVWPPHQIDHINGVRDENRIENLRCATYQQQRGNQKLYKNNSTGYRGVYVNKKTGKFFAHYSGQHIGTFETILEAAAAYTAKANAVWGEYYRDNSAADLTLPSIRA